MVIKGILEAITTANVNLVNADLLAKTRGLRIIESTVPSDGKVACPPIACIIGYISKMECSYINVLS